MALSRETGAAQALEALPRDEFDLLLVGDQGAFRKADVIRLTLVGFYVSFLIVYAWRDWFKSLCGLILLMGVIEHPDMPKNILGIQGLNLWNVVLLVVVASWLVHRPRENLKWDMPKGVVWLLAAYGIFIALAFVRMVSDLDGIQEWASLGLGEEPSFMSLFSEDVINCYKWVIPGLLLFDGARDDNRLRLAMAAILGVYVLLAIQVIRWMPFDVLSSGAALEERSSKILRNEVGFHRVNVSMMLAGASWALLAARLAVKSRPISWGLAGLAVAAMVGQALTGGRAGYVTWICIGVCVAWLRWRRAFVFAPILLLIVAAMVPAARERLFEGFDEESVDTNARLTETVDVEAGGPDWYTVTAGRVIAWPYVVDKILESPIVGHGREAMIRTGISTFLWVEYQEGFPHPHNAYLELALDSGLIGVFFIGWFYLVVVRRSGSLFRKSENPLHAAVGGVALSLTLALLFAGLGSQSFYPREGAVGMWCAIGLMMRAYLLRQTAAASVDQLTPRPSGRTPWRSAPSAQPQAQPQPSRSWRGSTGPI
jgi:O-antigen ligase